MTALEVISNSFIVEVTFGLGCYATIGTEAITKYYRLLLSIEHQYLQVHCFSSICPLLRARIYTHSSSPTRLSSLLTRLIHPSHLQIPSSSPSHTLHTNISRKSAVKKNRFASPTTCSSIIPVLFSHLYVLCSPIQVPEPGKTQQTQRRIKIKCGPRLLVLVFPNKVSPFSCYFNVF
jgi:hypothetical protein